MSQPLQNVPGMPNCTAPVPPNPPVLAPATKRKAASTEDDDRQLNASGTAYQSRAMATSNPKAAKRPKLSKDHGDATVGKSVRAVDSGFVVRDEVVMKDASTPETTKKTATPTVTRKSKSTAPAVAEGAKLRTTQKKQAKSTEASQSSSAVGTNDNNDVMIQDVPADPTQRVTGPISLEAFAAGVTTTGPDQVPAPVTAPAPASAFLARFFTKPLPAMHTPWPLSCAQAYDQYDQPTTSPINWDAFPNVEKQDRAAYDDREPWNPAPIAWNKVGKVAQAREGRENPLTDEGGRKRFIKANRAIFKATGVYFKRGTHGLQDGFNVPSESDMTRALKNASIVAAQLVTGAGVTQSINVAGAGAAQTIEIETRRNKKNRKPRDEDEPEAVAYELKVVELLLQPPDGSGPVTRYMTQKMWRKLQLVPGQTLCCSAATFDRWYSSSCFGVRHSLPRRVYILKKLSGGYAYVDEGVPPVTIHTLLDTYCLSQDMGTTRVSDMILDEIHRFLRNEAALTEKYGVMGGICEDDCNVVVRILDLTPEDIKKLWISTKVNDPIRKLLVHLFVLRAANSEWSTQYTDHARRNAQFASRLYSAFVRRYCHLAIESFVEALSRDNFCAKYHNHRNREPCYLSRHPSTLSKAKIDDTLNTSNIHKIAIEGVEYSIVNKTGDGLNMSALQANKSRWDWERVQSINSWIYIPPNGPQIRQPRPIYFPPDAADAYGRYPSHPGYMDAVWRLRIERDEYAQDQWELAKAFDIPEGATRCRDDKDTGEYLFDMEDDTWIPPSNFARDLQRREGQNWHEFQAYRRWLWTQGGGTIPKMTCKRWRPFMGPKNHREDTFRDAVQKQ
ncbi:hypothetical protein BDU57DRAFT_579328 [Ampelomyces quisqualis]|uniref:Uncharacterized protein n=1 Tax=Ampelomyces quisqualis TaxID=50730 RepID=A0A6A5QJZ1_AMPQU|nr:hypothetical protein BDU57DRAFT_579328 [Ampelomyces quisqualis]